MVTGDAAPARAAAVTTMCCGSAVVRTEIRAALSAERASDEGLGRHRVDQRSAKS